MKITRITGREIFDSRGLPTVECELELENGQTVVASVPTGTSRSKYEATMLYDGGSRLMGLGVTKAVENIERVIAPMFVGSEPNVVQMDTHMIEFDGTPEKTRLGANAMLAVSMAICKAQAIVDGMELYECIAYLCDFKTVTLPCPMFNIINGGVHANNKLQIQEYMIMPVGIGSFRVAMDLGVMIFQTLKELLAKRGKSTAVGEEGGFAASFSDEIEALDYIMEAVQKVEMEHEGSIMLALDVAASQFYNAKSRLYSWRDDKIEAGELIDWYKKLIKKYPIYAIEDGLSEDDWKGWEQLSKALDTNVQVVGDDIFATNAERIWYGIEHKVASAVVIKPSQIGTVTETLQAVKLCKEYDRAIIPSHRSGETNDTFIADLAVGISSGLIKAGGCTRGERMAKYNRLLTIEGELLLSF